MPDSAGTATALFSGVKTNYGVIGLDAMLSTRLPSIMDWGYAAGKRIGLVTTTRVTHATPSALYAHVPNRDWECDGSIPSDKRDQYTDIARQLIENAPGNRMNVILGGGKKIMGLNDPPSSGMENDTIEFHGKFENFCTRSDGRNLVDEWLRAKVDSGGAFVRNTGQLLAINSNEIDYLLGLFADNHMSYSSVRNQGPSGEPSLAQMTKKAIQVLARTDSQGFVLMVEGGRIDQAHHQNHARLALDETVQMDEAIAAALKETSRDDTLIIVTADHSHAVTLNGYPVRGNDILGFGNKAEVEPYETLSYANGPGFLDHRLNQSEEKNGRDGTWLRLDALDEEARKSPVYRHMAMLSMEDETHGGEDVPVYAIGPGASLIRGTFEQNYIGYVMGYAACIGPARKMNPHCRNDDNSNDHFHHQQNNGAGTLISFIYLLLIEMFYCFFDFI